MTIRTGGEGGTLGFDVTLQLVGVFINFRCRTIYVGAGIQGVSKKMRHLICLISLAMSSLESWDIFQIKGDFHRYVLSTISFLCDIGELRYRQNNTGYQNIKMVKYRLISYS